MFISAIDTATSPPTFTVEVFATAAADETVTASVVGVPNVVTLVQSDNPDADPGNRNLALGVNAPKSFYARFQVKTTPTPGNPASLTITLAGRRGTSTKTTAVKVAAEPLITGIAEFANGEVVVSRLESGAIGGTLTCV